MKGKVFGFVGSACLMLAKTLNGSTSSTNCTGKDILFPLSDISNNNTELG